MWFIYGFLLCGAIMALSILSLFNILTTNQDWSKRVTVGAALVYVMSFVWLVAGLYVRFKHEGRVCAGDFALVNGASLGDEPY